MLDQLTKAALRISESQKKIRENLHISGSWLGTSIIRRHYTDLSSVSRQLGCMFA
jgi:hypothetical protein